MSTVAVAVENNEGKRELTLADRCDRCGIASQAFAVAHKGSLELFFCGHHMREYGPALMAQGFIIQDETHRINLKPTNPEDFEV